MVDNLNFTCHAEDAIRNIMQNRVKTFYVREDFVRTIKEFKSCNTSELSTIKRKLFTMFNARGVEIKSFFDGKIFDEKKLEEILLIIPTKKELAINFLKELHQIYSVFPTSEDFITRLVDRLSPNELKKDSLRLRILKQFIINTNYHTKAIEKRVLRSLNKPKKILTKELIVENLTENIFSERDVDFSDWKKFFVKWFETNRTKFILRTFGTNEEINQLKTLENINLMFLADLEDRFLEYLKRINFIRNGTINGTRDELFISDKINLVINQANVFDVLNIEICGRYGMSLQKYSLLLSEFLRNMPIVYHLSSDTQLKLIRLARSLKIKSSPDEEISLLEAIASKDKININAERTAVLEKVEIEILNANILNNSVYRQKKSEFILKYTNFLNEELMKVSCRGQCGLRIEIWANFLLRQIEVNNAQKIFSIPDEVESVLSDVSVVGTSEIINHINQEFMLYLKNFRHGKEPSLAEVFKRAWKDHIRNTGEDMTLQNLAEDIASANFKFNGITKQELYLFAFAFDMTWNSVIKNLFQDYYQDNFLRYIEEKFTYDAPPLGQIINLKNFVESIYAYYIRNRNLGTAAERLEKAEKTISQCHEKAKKLNKSKSKILVSPKMTNFYKDNEDNFVNLEESELISYVIDNYFIYDPKATTPQIMMASEMNTARNCFLEILNLIKSKFPEHQETEGGLDIDNLVEYMQNSKESSILEISNDTKFVKLLKSLDNTLHVKRRGLLDENVIKARKYFSRTDLIALYYFYFVNVVLSDAVDDLDITDFEYLYYEFLDDNLPRFGLSHYLEECNFQPFSSTSIYDNFIIFCLFLEIIR